MLITKSVSESPIENACFLYFFFFSVALPEYGENSALFNSLFSYEIHILSLLGLP